MPPSYTPPVPAYQAGPGSILHPNKPLYDKIASAPRHLISSFTLPIRSGRAWTAPKGSIVRISTPEGPQVGDLNIWNLHNPRERFWAARSRQLHASHVSTYDRLWSCLPYMRPLVSIVGDSLGGEKYGVDKWGGRCHDLLGTRCDPYVNKMLTGDDFDYHCHSNLVRAVLPYGLNESDVHDVINIFQVTGLDKDGRYFMEASPATKDDYIEFFTEVDVLMALSTCPGGDLSVWGFGAGEKMRDVCRPLKVEVFGLDDGEAVLKGWSSPEVPDYKGKHGMGVPLGEGESRVYDYTLYYAHARRPSFTFAQRYATLVLLGPACAKDCAQPPVSHEILHSNSQGTQCVPPAIFNHHPDRLTPPRQHRMRTLTMCLVALALISTIVQARSLRSIFYLHSSCDAYRRQLDLYWDQIGTLNDEALNSLQRNNLFKSERMDRLKLAKGFFGFRPDDEGSDSDSDAEEVVNPPTNPLDLARWNKALRWYQDLKNLMGSRQSGRTKPKLMCDSNFMTFQTEKDTYLDRNGLKMLKNPNKPEDGYWTLREWVNSHGGNFDENWYFWIDIPGGDPEAPEKTYVVLKKSNGWEADEDDPDVPFPRDEDGNPSYCLDEGAYGLTLMPAPNTRAAIFNLQGPIMILCPGSFERAEHDELPTEKPAIDTTLDSMRYNGQTFHHELYHLVYPRGSPDAVIKRPKRVNGKRDPDWPDFKDTFVSAPDGAETVMAKYCLFLTLWDLADPEETDVDKLESNKNPETYTWFALANWLQNTFEQAWYLSVCKDSVTRSRVVSAFVNVTIGGGWEEDKMNATERELTLSVLSWKN